MKTVDIPGGSATFRESDDIRSRDADLIEAASMAASNAFRKLPADAGPKRPGETDEEVTARVEKAMEGVTFSFEESQSLMLLRRATVIATLDSWTLPLPLPTMDTIGDLPRDLVRALDAAIGGMPVTVGTDFTVSSDKRSPTEPSSDSSGSLRADSTPTTPSTPPSSVGTVGTATAVFTPA